MKVPADARGRRYSIRAHMRAQELKAAGWTSPAIARLLVREGLADTEPGRRTIDVWTKPKIAADHARRRDSHNAERYAANRIRRMSELKAGGLDPAGIAIVMRIYHGLTLSAVQVGEALDAEHPSNSPLVVVCGLCGTKLLSRSGRGRSRKWCSDTCRSKAYQSRAQGAPA